MTAKMLDSTLTLPEALMAFLHNKDGQVYQSARPKQLTAAAELGELALAGHVQFEDDKLVAGAPVEAGERPWMAEVVAGLPDKPIKVDAWLRKRSDSVKVQQEAALEHGVLSKDRAKLAGVLGYDRHLVDEAVRDGLLAELDGPGCLFLGAGQGAGQVAHHQGHRPGARLRRRSGRAADGPGRVR